ncbi:Similar to Protein BOI2; acc. no. P39969 [Pyronema omphalodes CBS 100304]|uniref:Similar to Protein BOI2 acc. no. P39969 n=1 Tax=Pyronema omphalodes (strain CBS 100304) TaxID=1076935 RepID=U4L3L8_PYROM|nr:Similar to Protein BOI2; acc. no. P39969 [Pyronema omphalodes CBS 100304]
MGDHSSAATALNAALSAGVAVLHAGGNEKHSRVSSFDKNWASSVIAGLHRPSTPSNKEKGKHKASPSAGTANTTDTGDSGFSGSINSPEKSYFSGGESSPQELHSRHSRISSAGEAVRRTSSTTLSAMQAYHDKSKHKRKSASFSGEPSILFNSPSSPISTTLSSEGTIGTKSLDKSDDGLGLLQSPTDPASPPPSAPQVGTASTGFFGAPISRSISPQSFINIPFGNRSISEAMRRTPKPEKNAVTKSTTPTKSEDVPTPTSPVARSISTAGTGRTSSSSADPPATAATTVTHQDPPLRPPKANRSKNKDSTKTQTRQRIRSISSGSGLRQKSKKQTTAWEKGLREITPADAAKDADFSGWMKKRGSSGVGAWKQRFFVLEGRRLSYFYSMDDTKERGVIDITSHKVLPATEDRLVGLHAAWAAATTPGSRIVSSPLPVTSATGSPSAPASADLDPESPCEAPSVPSADAKADPKATKVKKEHGWFTFKLLPPAPGAAKGVTFTPPRTHYFATDTKQQGKTWMASLMKATIDRDETKPVIMSYAAKTISLRRAREMRARPPGLGIDGLPQVPMHEGEGEESSSDEEGEVSDEEDQGVSIRIEIQQQPRTASLEGKIREIMSDGEEQQENQEMDNLGDMDLGPAGFDIDHSMFERPKSVLPKGKGEQQGLKMAVGIVG